MRNSAGRKIWGLISLTVLIITLSGCGQRLEKQTETQTQQRQTEEQEPVTETEHLTEAVTETESESETQQLITLVDYTSKDGTVKITLPDNTWKVTQDADENRVFQSGNASTGNAAIINIVHISTETAMKNLSVQTSEEELKASLKEQYKNDETAYDVMEFSTASVDEINIYRYLVRYNAAARMWAYSITNAIVGTDQAYIVTGTLTDDNAVQLEAVQKAVQSFRVISDEAFKAATGEVLSGTTQQMTETETVDTTTVSEAELKSLTDYGTTVSLVTSDTVNVRLSPGTDSAILTTLAQSASVSVVGETTNWFKVTINGYTGYIRKDFLVYASSTSTEAQTNAETTVTTGGASSAELSTATTYGSAATLYSTGEVNVRSMPGTDSDVIDALSGGSSVTVTGETDNWFIVSVNGVTGYVSKALLSTEAGTSSDSGSSGTGSSETSVSGGETSASSAVSTITGQVVDVTVDTITIAANNGSTYSVYYGSANVSTSEGLYSGVNVVVTVDDAQSSGGSLYATSVSGN